MRNVFGQNVIISGQVTNGAKLVDESLVQPDNNTIPENEISECKLSIFEQLISSKLNTFISTTNRTSSLGKVLVALLGFFRLYFVLLLFLLLLHGHDVDGDDNSFVVYSIDDVVELFGYVIKHNLNIARLGRQEETLFVLTLDRGLGQHKELNSRKEQLRRIIIVKLGVMNSLQADSFKKYT
uniref:Uncharacterized protein n=1 Tax=Glossina austeni TaxID=7395 RepID=A0A1A9UD88_GLOAU